MQATRAVYLLIGFVMLLPWFALSIKKMIPGWKQTGKPPMIRTIVLLCGALLIVTGVFGHYRFTIGYQAPLVAEQAGNLFSKRLAGEMDLPSYRERMIKKGLAVADFTTMSGEQLEQAGFQRKPYNLSISQRSYEVERNVTILYLMHTDERDTLYSSVKMRLTRNRWLVLEHQIISMEELDAVESKMKFFAVRP